GGNGRRKARGLPGRRHRRGEAPDRFRGFDQGAAEIGLGTEDWRNTCSRSPHSSSGLRNELSMSKSRTLTIIKPDAFSTNKAGLILAHLEKGGFRLIASRVMKLSREQAGEFYAVHKGRPFYPELVEFMTSGYCMPMVLERENAVLALRDAIGAT